MKKVKRISVVIAKFGSDPEHVEVAEDLTVEEVLKETGANRVAEKIFINGERATLKDIVEDGDNILLVSPKEAGIRSTA